VIAEPAPPAGPYPAGIALYPLTFVDEGDHVIIGRPDIDSFAVFPADAAAVLRRLRAGADLDSVAAWYADEYGEPADIDDFVETLRDLEFIRPDNELQEPAAPATARVRLRRFAAIVLSGPALALYALAACGAIYLVVAVPALRPVPSAVFFSRFLLIVLAVTTVGDLSGIAMHEAFHVLAGRRLGLASKLSVGRRLYFLVFETTLMGLMGVPARKRILPLCAGLIADAVLTSILIGVAEAGRIAGWPGWIGRVAIALAYVTIVRMLWQGLIFMETDLYHVLTTALKCPDLHRMSRVYLRNRLRRFRGRGGAEDEAAWTARERKIVRCYAPFVVVCGAAMIGAMAAYSLPVLAELAGRIYRNAAAGGLARPQFWDSVAVSALILSQFALAGAIGIRDRRRRKVASNHA
jgi:hypothetical protein